MDWFDAFFDLAAVASGAGLAGAVIAALVVTAFSGAVLRFIIRIVVTGIITGIGFYYLLGWLGFEIVPRDEVAAAPVPTASIYAQSESFLPARENELAGGASGTEEDQPSARRIAVSSPFRRGD